ncbi:MAG: hypothetical protein M5U01_29410 [Ardenticatenaceae bacterium]|nr:hypothetical protein [Ardenticatenaceae bacterium]HBY92621.1 hypothetical protein [Chloroflexota bacterium]
MGSLSTWAALATVLLALECFVVMLVVGALVFGLKFGMDWVLRNTVAGFRIANDYFARGKALLERYEARIAAPVVRARAAWYGLQRARRALTHEK